MFSVFDYVHYCMQNAEENKLKLKLKLLRNSRVLFSLWFLQVTTNKSLFAGR